MADASVASGHPVETWGALIGSLTLLIGTVGIIYKRLNDDIKAESDKNAATKVQFDKKFDNGISAFATIGKELATIGAKLAEIDRDGTFINSELDRLELDIRSLHTRLVIIETEHKACQEIVRGIGK